MYRVMLIEDDEISLRFIAEALALLPVQVDECCNFTEAKVLLESSFYQLIISDIHLPDGNLLHEVQFFPQQIMKIATSAEINPNITSRLKEAGIDVVLSKPMSIATLHQTVRQLLGLKLPTNKECVLWDDQKALSTLGDNKESLKSLKNLFKVELPQMLLQINTEFKNSNHTKIVDILHKLKASCGFLGANKLLTECYCFESNINSDSLVQFSQIAKQTLDTI